MSSDNGGISRLLVLTQYYVPEGVGFGQQIHDFCREWVRRDRSATVLTTYPNYPSGRLEGRRAFYAITRERVDGVDVIRAPLISWESYGAIAKIGRSVCFGLTSMMAALRYRLWQEADVVLVVSPPPLLGAATRVCSGNYRRTVVLNVQDLYPDALDRLGVAGAGILRPIGSWLMKAQLQRAARILAVSEEIGSTTMARLSEYGIPDARSRVAYFPNWWSNADALNASERLAARDKARDAYGIGSGEFVVTYSGSLSRNTDFDGLLGAARLLRTNRSVRFFIAGDGVRAAEIREAVREAGLTNVELLPFQSLEEYERLLRASDLGVIPLAADASGVSFPSKIYKMLRVGLAPLALTAESSSFRRFVEAEAIGYGAAPSDAAEIASVVEEAAAGSVDGGLGDRGRRLFNAQFTTGSAVDRLDDLLGVSRSDSREMRVAPLPAALGGG